MQSESKNSGENLGDFQKEPVSNEHTVKYTYELELELEKYIQKIVIMKADGRSEKDHMIDRWQ